MIQNEHADTTDTDKHAQSLNHDRRTTSRYGNGHHSVHRDNEGAPTPVLTASQRRPQRSPPVAALVTLVLVTVGARVRWTSTDHHRHAMPSSATSSGERAAPRPPVTALTPALSPDHSRVGQSLRLTASQNHIGFGSALAAGMKRRRRPGVHRMPMTGASATSNTSSHVDNLKARSPTETKALLPSVQPNVVPGSTDRDGLKPAVAVSVAQQQQLTPLPLTQAAWTTASQKACQQILTSTRRALSAWNFSSILTQPHVTDPPSFVHTFAHTRAWTWKTRIDDHLRDSRAVDWSMIGERCLQWPCPHGCADHDREVRFWHNVRGNASPWLRQNNATRYPETVIIPGDATALEVLRDALDHIDTSDSKTDATSLPVLQSHEPTKSSLTGVEAVPSLASSSSSSSPFRVLVISGSDFNALPTSPAGLDLLKRGFFHKILVEALEEPIDSGVAAPTSVSTAPIGLTVSYTQGHTAAMVSAALHASSLSLHDDEHDDAWRARKRPPGLLAAWGHVWRGLDNLPSRKRAAAWLALPSAAWTGRRRKLAPDDYFVNLAQSRFLIAPRGAGVQSPKLVEALLMRTIPIVERGPQAFEDLAVMGYPIVLVEQWDAINPRLLQVWWEALSPLLETAQWMLLRDMWLAYVLHPCPGTIHTFVKAIRHGQCDALLHTTLTVSKPTTASTTTPCGVNRTLYCNDMKPGLGRPGPQYCHTVLPG
eukprot:m.197025 g.197025  ORF g.197025 m.197025 type:complete len:710 (+) comp19976_c0_seq1:252-2381(+)